MLKQQLQQDIIKALKRGEKTKLESLRYLVAQIKNAEIEKGKSELPDEEIIKIITSQIKKLEETLVLVNQAQRQDLRQKTLAEIETLSAYLPKQLSQEELLEAIKKIKAEHGEIQNAGALTGLAVKILRGKADNRRIAQTVQELFKE
jgi:uncharacterized protein YqeY